MEGMSDWMNDIEQILWNTLNYVDLICNYYLFYGLAKYNLDYKFSFS